MLLSNRVTVLFLFFGYVSEGVYSFSKATLIATNRLQINTIVATTTTVVSLLCAVKKPTAKIISPFV